MRNALMSVLTVLAYSSTVNAYYIESRTPNMEPVRYTDSDAATADTVDVVYRINTTGVPLGEPALEAIRAAFQTWNSTPCSTLRFTEGAPSTSTDRSHWQQDNGEVYVLVFFTDSDEVWNTGRSVGNFYFAHDGSGTGRLIGGTVVLNTRDHQWATDGTATAMDVQGTVTALIGRSLGITSDMEGNATFPRYTTGDTSKRTLGTDEIAALQYLYGSEDASCTDPPPPQMVCDGVPPRTGETGCPPRPEIRNDAGTGIPPRDSGVTPAYDAGLTTGEPDSGIDRDAPDSGCSCRAAGLGRDDTSATFVGLAVGVALFVARRRRRR